MINFCLFLFFRFFFLLIRFLPRGLILALGTWFGSLAHSLSPFYRRICLKNLEIAYGSELKEEAKRRLAREAFLHFGRMVLDTIKFASLDEKHRSALITIDGLENLQKALSLDRGMLIFSAHLGNWEVASWIVASATPLHVVARPLDNPWLEKELFCLRKKLGAQVISKFQAARPVLRALQANEAVAILIDQNVLRSQAVFVDFFGRQAATTPALASFHLRTKAPILPIFCLMRPDKRYQVKIYPPLSFASHKKIEPSLLLQITGVLTKMIEQEIRKNPEQWLWFHDRWRSRPVEEN